MNQNIKVTAQAGNSIQAAEVTAVFAASAPEALDRAMTRLDRFADENGLVVSCENYTARQAEAGVYDLTFS